MELVVTEIERGINRLEGFKVDIDPSSVMTVPQYMTRPFLGHLLYSLSRCCVLVIAPNTDRRLTRDLIFEAVPYSSANILAI